MADIRAKLRQSVRDTFSSPNGKKTLEWMKQFCHADEATFVRDDPSGRLSAHAEGRREVYLLINKILTHSEADLARTKE